MRFTRVKTTLMAGVLAASMVMPGMAVYADEVDEGDNTAEQATGLNSESATNVSELKIDKLIKVADGITIPGTITFKVEQYDAKANTTQKENGDGTVQPSLKTGEGVQSYPATYDIYGDVTGKTDAINVDGTKLASDDTSYEANGANRLVSTSNILTDLQGACQENGEYTFKITETAPTSKDAETTYGWTIDQTAYYLHVYVTTGDNGDKQYQYLATRGAQTNGVYSGAESFTEKSGDAAATYNNKVSEIKFSNTYTKKGGSDQTPSDPDSPTPKESASLWISKTVDGTSAGYEQSGTEYEFTVSFTGSNTATVPDAGYAYKIYGSDNKEVEGKGGSITSSNKTIKLQNGQYAVFEDIPAGIQAKVEEKVDDLVNIQNYTVKVTSNGETVSSKDGTQKNNKDTNNFLIGEGQNSAEFTNTYSDITVTGVVTSIAPYVTLVVAAVIAVAAYMGLKNRIAR